MVKGALSRHFSLFWHPRVKHLKRRARGSGRQLKALQNHTSRIRANDRLLVAVGKNENHRIPYFLEYYRKLGIDHFLFVDNQSDPPMSDILLGQADVSLWRTEQDYAEAGSGVDWINFLLSSHAVGHWVLTVDLDEFFVYPFMESRSYNELLEYHDDIEKPCMFAIQVDMYPKESVSSICLPMGESPLKLAPYFDSEGYRQSKGEHHETRVQGGARMRLMRDDSTGNAPFLNKTPLIKWRFRYAYDNRTRVAFPPILNMAHQKFHVPTAALLHFNLMQSNHTAINPSDSGSLCDSMSVRYVNSQSLVDANIMTPGGWK